MTRDSQNIESVLAKASEGPSMETGQPQDDVEFSTSEKPDVTTEPFEESTDLSITPFPLSFSNSTSNDTTYVFPKFDNWDKFRCYFMNPVVGTTGMILNSLGLVVLFRLNRHFGFHYCLISLLILDEIYLLVGLGKCVPQYISHIDVSYANFINAYTEDILNIFKIAVFSIYTYTVALMSLERCFYIKFPLKKIENQKKNTICLILVLSVISLGLHGILAYFIAIGQIKEYVDGDTNQTLFVQLRQDANPTFKFWFIILHILVTKLLPLLVVILCNIVICVMLARVRNNRRKLFSDAGNAKARQQSEQIKMTLTLSVISIFLCVSLIPIFSGSLVTIFYPERFSQGKKDYITLDKLMDFAMTMQTLSASTDFIIYILVSRSTRSIVTAMFRKG